MSQATAFLQIPSSSAGVLCHLSLGSHLTTLLLQNYLSEMCTKGQTKHLTDFVCHLTSYILQSLIIFQIFLEYA